MTTIDHLIAQIAPPQLIRLRLLSGEPLGPRLITSPTSPLVVGVTPVDRVPELLRLVPALSRPVAYTLMEQPCLRVGETLDFASRWTEHLAKPPLTAEEVAVIGSLHDDLGKDGVTALQLALTHQARRAGRITVIGGPPQRAWLALTDPGLVARWLADLRSLLVGAGLRILEAPGARLRPRVEIDAPEAPEGVDLALPLRAGYVTEIPSWIYEQPAAHYELDHNGARAQAIVIDGLCVVLAGALMAADDRSGIQLCLSRKRERLHEDGLVRPTGREGLVRVAVDLGVPSLTNAGRLLTGTNLARNELWARAA